MLKYHIKTVLICLLLLTGCTAFQAQSTLPADSPTNWTQKESGAFLVSGEKVFLGMGVSSGTDNTLLLRSSADNLAQAEVFNILIDFTKALAYNVMGHNGIDAKDKIDAGALAIAKNTAADAVIVDHWQNRDSGQYYALCRLPLETFKSRLAAHPAFDQKTRQAMLSRADKLFDYRIRSYLP